MKDRDDVSTALIVRSDYAADVRGWELHDIVGGLVCQVISAADC